jgi:alpha-L-fucosidase
VQHKYFSAIILCFIPLAIFGSTLKENLADWRENRFGMFIHWGAYSQAEGIHFNGTDSEYVDTGHIFNRFRPLAGAEWIMDWRDIDRTDYRSMYAEQFLPTNFNAATIVNYAKDAGMQYLVVTAKHHEGFCMFNTDSVSFGADTSYKFRHYNGYDPIMQLKNA